MGFTPAFPMHPKPHCDEVAFEKPRKVERIFRFLLRITTTSGGQIVNSNLLKISSNQFSSRFFHS
jgi:hypothetical protein